MPTVSVVIPTRNEEKNVAKLIPLIKPLGYEIIVVDDSIDDTAVIARQLGARIVTGQHKGLGQAIVDGIQASHSDIVLVMDADLSHPPRFIPDMVNPILYDGYDMTIGSRYVKGGSIQGWTPNRILISKVASSIAYPITWIRDNTSGFFAFRKYILNGHELKPDSWKIMLETLIKTSPTAFKEVPICFEDRTEGESKFNIKEVKNYLKHIIKLGIYKYQAFLKFGVIGASGAALHFGLLYLFTDVANLWYILSAVLSIVIASTSNYILNHKFTFKDRQVTNHILGWFKYQVMSGITDGLYIGILALFVEVFGIWYILGALMAAACVYPVKFLVASILIWGKKLDCAQDDYEWMAYHRGGVVQKWWKRSISNTVHEWIPETRSILEVGCGSSPTIGYYRKNAVAIDTNASKIALMKKKLPLVCFRTKNIFDVGGKYQHIICIEVLEHLHTYESVIKRMVCLLEDGGKIVLATPDYSKILWRIAEFFTPYKEEHVTQFTRKSLENLCAKYGLKPVKHRYVATCDLIEMFEKAS